MKCILINDRSARAHRWERFSREVSVTMIRGGVFLLTEDQVRQLGEAKIGHSVLSRAEADALGSKVRRATN